MSNNEARGSDSPVPGTSGVSRKINYKRPRRVYSSSDDDGDDEGTSVPPTPKRTCARDDVADQRLDFLQKQVSELKYLLTRNYHDVQKSTAETEGLRESLGDDDSVASCLIKPDEPDFEWDDCTVTSEAVKRTAELKLNYLRKIQHFDSSEWNSVRYTDVQKKYISSPAFTNLAVNDELMAYETKFCQSRSLDQSFGAMTNMLIAQKESLQTALKDLLAWSADSDTQLTRASLASKVHELFSNTCPYMSVSKDLLQMVCGRRANIIEHRRENALSAVKDKYNKAILRKIPPSCEYIFQAKEFSDAVVKLGGGSKVFRRPFLPAEGNQVTHNRPYVPAEGNQAAPRRSTDPVVPFRGYSNPNRNQQAPASGKGKSLVGKRPYSNAKNKSHQRPRDRYRDNQRKQ